MHEVRDTTTQAADAASRVAALLFQWATGKPPESLSRTGADPAPQEPGELAILVRSGVGVGCLYVRLADVSPDDAAPVVLDRLARGAVRIGLSELVFELVARARLDPKGAVEAIAGAAGARCRLVAGPALNGERCARMPVAGENARLVIATERPDCLQRAKQAWMGGMASPAWLEVHGAGALGVALRLDEGMLIGSVREPEGTAADTCAGGGARWSFRCRAGGVTPGGLLWFEDLVYEAQDSEPGWNAELLEADGSPVLVVAPAPSDEDATIEFGSDGQRRSS